MASRMRRRGVLIWRWSQPISAKSQGKSRFTMRIRSSRSDPVDAAVPSAGLPSRLAEPVGTAFSGPVGVLAPLDASAGGWGNGMAGATPNLCDVWIMEYLLVTVAA